MGALEFLLNHGASPLTCDVNGWSPLLVATFCGHAPAVALLLARGADKSVATTSKSDGFAAGSTPLSVARKKGHSKIVALLR